jgi:hypothetical protein
MKVSRRRHEESLAKVEQKRRAEIKTLADVVQFEYDFGHSPERPAAKDNPPKSSLSRYVSHRMETNG